MCVWYVRVCECARLEKRSGACRCAAGSIVGSTGAFIFPAASLPRTIFKNSILLNIEALSCSSVCVCKREREREKATECVSESCLI